MKTVILDPQPAEVEALIERRRALGQDRFDEVWEGVYHMTPGPSGTHAYLDSELSAVLRPYARAAGLVATTAFNLGDGPDDFRVPDAGFHRSIPVGTWVPTAAIVVEILRPGDETFEKFGFYLPRVEEVIVADPASRAIRLWHRGEEGYVEGTASPLLRVAADELAAAVDWP
ncbi:MAG TPA: Uma2 family endonuclease [Acidimicrobiales bacterium]|nr:Uma2 family endonuclease [Acidimicrobiales bacterium]